MQDPVAMLGVPAVFQMAFELHRQGQLSEASRLYSEVIKAAPRHHDALHYLGILALQAGHPAKGLEMMAQALALTPDDPSLHQNMASALTALGRLDEAAASHRRAIALQGDAPRAHRSLADVLQRAGRPDEAVASYDAAIALEPDEADLRSSRADALYALRRFDEAEAGYAAAITLRPDHSDAHMGRGNTLRELGRFDAALASYDAAIAANPKSAVAFYNRGNALRYVGRVEDAIASYAAAIALQPDFAVAHHNHAVCLLQVGDMASGFREYEWRKRCPDVDDPRFALTPVWTGAEDLAGKTLFVFPELFLGDMIQFCRYLPHAEARGARVILAAPASLHGLLRTLSPTIELLPADATPARFDYACALMSLPLAFRTTPQSMPAQVPYLHVEPERVARWAARIGAGGFKVGVCWQGSTRPYALPLQRSFPLRALQGLGQHPGVRLISLQKYDGLDQLTDLPDGMVVETPGGDGLDAGPDAFLDTAAAMACCDLVLTVDTAVAHLAGALGARTWVALPRVTDWRWPQNRSDSPWYPGMRLFRQEAWGDWTGVFHQIKLALGTQLTEASRR